MFQRTLVMINSMDQGVFGINCCLEIYDEQSDLGCAFHESEQAPEREFGLVFGFVYNHRLGGISVLAGTFKNLA